MREHHINKLNNFIAGWYISEKICDKLIDYHKTSNKKFSGETIGGINKGSKDSTDIVVENNPTTIEYLDYLYTVTDNYVNKYSYCNYYDPWTLTTSMVIQHYKPGQAFNAWHCERAIKEEQFITRHLVFMTYLNTVDSGGETEWFHQNISVKPEKGLTLIWPTDWTFTHRGLPSYTEDKYIITGWYNFFTK